MATFLERLVDEFRLPKHQGTHGADGSVGEVLMKWSGNYRVRWFEGPRAGKVAYESIWAIKVKEMPKDHVFPPTPHPPRPSPDVVEAGLGI